MSISAGSGRTQLTAPDRPLGAADLAVVIPTRDRWDTLGTTLRALEEQTERGFETIVVVDGSEQRPPPLPRVRVLQQEHAGPGAARNRGVGATARRVVLFLGDDMVPDRDVVARHLELHRDHPDERFAVLGRVKWHRSVQRSRLHQWLEWSGALFDFPAGHAATGTDAGWQRFYSCNVSIKREFFTAAGGFDPQFVFDYEDLDMGWRLSRRGLRLVYEPRAVARHLHRYDWAAVERRYRSRAGAERLMMAKHDWFEPWFYNQMAAAERQRPASSLWALAAGRIPRRAGPLKCKVQQRADLHYRQRLAPAFLAAWEASAPGERAAPGERGP